MRRRKPRPGREAEEKRRACEPSGADHPTPPDEDPAPRPVSAIDTVLLRELSSLVDPKVPTVEMGALISLAQRGWIDLAIRRKRTSWVLTEAGHREVEVYRAASGGGAA